MAGDGRSRWHDNHEGKLEYDSFFIILLPIHMGAERRQLLCNAQCTRKASFSALLWGLHSGVRASKSSRASHPCINEVYPALYAFSSRFASILLQRVSRTPIRRRIEPLSAKITEGGHVVSRYL